MKICSLTFGSNVASLYIFYNDELCAGPGVRGDGLMNGLHHWVGRACYWAFVMHVRSLVDCKKGGIELRGHGIPRACGDESI